MVQYSKCLFVKLHSLTVQLRLFSFYVGRHFLFLLFDLIYKSVFLIWRKKKKQEQNGLTKEEGTSEEGAEGGEGKERGAVIPIHVLILIAIVQHLNF